jgi:hypothetical protein
MQKALDPRSLVDIYLDALAAHDYDRARGYLADEGFRYESPIAAFSNADDFIRHMSITGGITQDIVRRKVFTDGADVCHFLLYGFQISEKETAKVAQWAHVEKGRIQWIEILYDASGYHRFFEASP